MTNPSKVAADLRAAGLTSPMYEGAAGMFGGQMFDPNQMVPAHASALRASALRQGGDLTEADALRRYEEAGGKPGEFPGVIPTATQVTGGGTAPGPEPLSATWADTILERRAGGNNLFLPASYALPEDLAQRMSPVQENFNPRDMYDVTEGGDIAAYGGFGDVQELIEGFPSTSKETKEGDKSESKREKSLLRSQGETDAYLEDQTETPTGGATGGLEGTFSDIKKVVDSSWAAKGRFYDENVEEKRKKYMSNMNDIFSKAMMLKVLGRLSGNDGEDMSKMFMQFAFDKMDKQKEFDGMDRLKNLRQGVFYRVGAGGELVFDPPEFRREAHRRAIALGATTKEAVAISGHLEHKKQPSTTKANYRVWHRIVDGKLQQISHRGDELPADGGSKVPWLAMAYSPPTAKAGTEFERFVARARNHIKNGNDSEAVNELRIFFRKREHWMQAEVSPERLEQLVQDTMRDLGSSTMSPGAGGVETRAQIIARVTRENPRKSVGERATMVENELRRQKR